MVENAIFTLKTQIMATLTLVIVPAKRLSDGTHKIRIRVAHNSETRFITTDIVVRENEFKNGKIVHRPDKDFLNTKLQQLYNLYFKRYMELDYPDSLTCTQLVKMITNPLNGEKMKKNVPRHTSSIGWPQTSLCNSSGTVLSWNILPLSE